MIVLKGEAKLLVEGEHDPITMRPGDHVLIPAHRKHRVEWTRVIYEAAGHSERFEHRWGGGGHRFYADLMWPFVTNAVEE